MSSTIFYPKTRNFPHQPQVLHQMVLQFFLMTDKFESVFADQTSSHGMIMPYGSYFDTGLLQAASYRYRLRPLQATTIYIISFADLPESIDILGCNYEALHTFFGQLTVYSDAYRPLKSLYKDDGLFAAHADPIISQLPFIRSYEKIDKIVPLIINKKSPQLSGKDIWKEIRTSLYDTSGNSAYIICANVIDDSIERVVNAYQEVTSEQMLSFSQE